MLVTLSCIPYFIWATGLFLLNIDLEHKLRIAHTIRSFRLKAIPQNYVTL